MKMIGFAYEIYAYTLPAIVTERLNEWIEPDRFEIINREHNAVTQLLDTSYKLDSIRYQFVLLDFGCWI